MNELNDVNHRMYHGNNPWTGGSPSGMKNGTVKFFHNAKGFGRVAGSVGGSTVKGCWIGLDAGGRSSIGKSGDGGVIQLGIDVSALLNR